MQRVVLWPESPRLVYHRNGIDFDPEFISIDISTSTAMPPPPTTNEANRPRTIVNQLSPHFYDKARDVCGQSRRGRTRIRKITGYRLSKFLRDSLTPSSCSIPARFRPRTMTNLLHFATLDCQSPYRIVLYFCLSPNLAAATISSPNCRPICKPQGMPVPFGGPISRASRAGVRGRTGWTNRIESGEADIT